MRDVIIVDCISTLFWNYSGRDIELLKQSSDFCYVWDTYIAPTGGGEKAFNALWDAWMVKFSAETKALITAYALEKYESEKIRAYESQATLRRIARRNP